MLVIKHVSENVVVFMLRDKLWYLRIGPGAPAVFDERLQRLVVPNIDTWFQNETGHRYSYHAVCDMASAFALGANCSYSADNVRSICVAVCRTLLVSIFRTKYAARYARLYWIELLGPTRLISVAKALRSSFDNLLEKHGVPVIHNHLCRLWKAALSYGLSESTLFEKLAARIGRQLREPDFPDSTSIDDELIGRIVTSLNLSQYKDVTPDILLNVERVKCDKI